MPQFWVDLPGFGKVRLDVAYPQWKIALEYNGEEFHDSPEARAADEKRVQALRAAGWIVIVVTKDDFRRAVNGRWLLDVADAIRERRSQHRRVYSRGERRTPGRRHG